MDESKGRIATMSTVPPKVGFYKLFSFWACCPFLRFCRSCFLAGSPSAVLSMTLSTFWEVFCLVFGNTLHSTAFSTLLSTFFKNWAFCVVHCLALHHFRKPYQISGCIQQANFGGDYLQSDCRSGRVVYFPNSLMLKSEVTNYSGPALPFIWNETALLTAYNSNLKFVENCLLEVATLNFKERYPEKVQFPEGTAR